MPASISSRARSLSLLFHHNRADPASTPAAMTKPGHHDLEIRPVPADQPSTAGGAVLPAASASAAAAAAAAHASGPQKDPLHHHLSCAAVITPPASPPVPSSLQDDGSHSSNFSTTAVTGTAAPTGTPSDDTRSLAQSQTSSTARNSRREYMESLVPPSHDEFEKIAEVQRAREEEIKKNKSKLRSMQTQHLHDHFHSPRRSRDGHSDAAAGDEAQPPSQPQPHPHPHPHSGGGDSDAVNRAATLIQRNYRGYRVRREMQGLSLDPSTRWVSAIDELQFRELNRPRAKSSASAAGMAAAAAANGDQHSVLSRDPEGGMARPATARENWKKAATIARRAGHDDLESDSDSSSSSSSSSSSLSAAAADGGEEAAEQRRAEKRRRREEAVARRKKDSQMMGLQYFLEMVDLKHRYGSNLRVYHEEWKRADTNENFFYWLDYGAGRGVEMEACPRDRLEREQVRYLSREERQYYLVQVDDEGRLCWAKNGARIDTTEAYKDSIHGIVPADDPTPAWSQNTLPQPPGSRNNDDDDDDDDDGRSSSSVESALEADRAAKYATPELDGATGVRKVSHISAATVFNKLLRKSVRKNTWIFVADTSFRLYVGIKASGAFQHSSFLQGSRISSAGLIKVKEGRLASLSPLSGHYRPPASNFRAFVRNLRAAGVDTSRVSISKSYAVLVGLEAYVKTRRKGRRALERAARGKDRIVAPEAVRRRDEEERDKSESAAREREVLEREAEKREGNRAAARLMRKLNLAPQVPAGQKGPEEGAVMEPLAEERTREAAAAAAAAGTTGGGSGA